VASTAVLDYPTGHVALVLTLKLLALAASTLIYAVFPARLGTGLAACLQRLDARGVVRVLGVGLPAVYAIAWVTTPQIDWGAGELGLGYGADGVHYGRMTERFAWFQEPGIGHHYYRILAPALVHYSGLDTFTGFHLLNVLSFVLASMLMYATARRLDFARETSLLALALFAVLKFGVKFWIYYPVLTDGLGTLLMMSIIYATVSRRDILYVASMSAAVFCRENLIVLVVFHLLHSIRCGRVADRYGRMLVLYGIPLMLLALSRAFPIFPVQVLSVGLLEYLGAHAWSFVSSPKTQGVFAIGYLNSLGLVVVLALYRAGHVARFLRVHYEWLYFAVTMIAMSIVLGVDVDRYALCLAPALIVASLDPVPRVDGSAARLWVYLLLVHAASMELFLPWYPDRAFTNSLTAAHAQRDAYAALTMASLALLSSLVAVRHVQREGRW
jgi:hypothetical protein